MGKSYYEHLSGRIDADDIKLGWCDGITVLECVKAHSTRPHTHPHTEMIFCIKGKFTYRIDGIGEVSFGAGMGLVLPAHVRHALKDDTDAPGKRLGLHLHKRMMPSQRFTVFTPSDYNAFMRTIIAKAGIPFKLPPSLFASVKRLAEFLSPDQASRVSSEQCLVRILCCSILYDTVTALSNPILPDHPQHMEEAVKFLEERCSEQIRIADLVRHIGYGRARLFELFKQKTGLSPGDYLLRFRIRKAQELLATTDLPVREISLHVGISDPSYFSTLFKRQTGCTPVKYRTDVRTSMENSMDTSLASHLHR